ncbi:TPR Domain containing protein [Diplonema papillatum]|nr:TPR Domain containing protein [Diplonema papillatum]|eukprot:gene9035-13987_t
MPIGADYQWEETDEKVLVRVFLRNVKRAAIDVYIADCYVKVNCVPFLWEADLKNHIDPSRSRYGIEESGTVRISLQKATAGLSWTDLKHDPLAPDRVSRREASKDRAIEFYNANIEARERQKVVAEKRFFSEHWELEKQQRTQIEARILEEKTSVAEDLDRWQADIAARPTRQKQEQAQQESGAELRKPERQVAAVGEAGNAIFDSAANEAQAPIRGVGTTTVDIHFTPAHAIHLPSRTRADDEFYRRSRYKPKSLQDTPFFFKERGDKQCAKKDWAGAVDSYSAALKRDTCFLAALNNRAAAYLRLHDYVRAIEDCSLSINMLQNTPASLTTGERFRHGMMKGYARRAAALCWAGEYRAGMNDLLVAIGYSTGGELSEESENAKLHADLETVKERMRSLGMLTEFEVSPAARKKADADKMVSARDYEGALAAYDSVLAESPGMQDAQANRVVALLCLKKFAEASQACDAIIHSCANVTNALVSAGVGELATACGDSDDEDEAPDEQKQANGIVKQNTSRVYALLKAYVRKGAACAGLKDWRGAYEYHELALRMMPYDDDLRLDAETFRQKLQTNNVLAAATNKTDQLQ